MPDGYQPLFDPGGRVRRRRSWVLGRPDMSNVSDATVGFAGDWHGNERWAVGCVSAFADLGVSTVYHLGDFGLWPGADGERYLVSLHRACQAAGITLYITLGNHEDYDRVAAMPTDDTGWLYLEGYPLFRFAPRGHVWRDAGVLFASLGGAGSIDRSRRVEGTSWWPQEAVTRGDVDALRRNVAASGGGRIDVMLTHDAPAGLHRRGMTPRPSWITDDVEAYCWEGRVLLADACNVAQPRALLHGHWHDWYEDTLERDGYETKVWGLPEDGTFRNCITAVPTEGVGLTHVRFALV